MRGEYYTRDGHLYEVVRVVRGAVWLDDVAMDCDALQPGLRVSFPVLANEFEVVDRG
jgi:hypothetical protein